ncbi:uncharacterized protein LOC126745480 isoform X5 [Anthonomus grandis grandis]|uniref:uncharacterized protein LOC126745480 isoform X5 n=1 Tax=Anthonomus grandis grandis TaxID=2921223 RepID=UPI002166BB99|nr:uncharacterized protein LOC126745480 isoform X5 [Anthonomus grandis grandis]
MKKRNNMESGPEKPKNSIVLSVEDLTRLGVKVDSLPTASGEQLYNGKHPENAKGNLLYTLEVSPQQLEVAKAAGKTFKTTMDIPVTNSLKANFVPVPRKTVQIISNEKVFIPKKDLQRFIQPRVEKFITAQSQVGPHISKNSNIQFSRSNLKAPKLSKATQECKEPYAKKLAVNAEEVKKVRNNLSKILATAKAFKPSVPREEKMNDSALDINTGNANNILPKNKLEVVRHTTLEKHNSDDEDVFEEYLKEHPEAKNIEVDAEDTSDPFEEYLLQNNNLTPIIKSTDKKFDMVNLIDDNCINKNGNFVDITKKILASEREEVEESFQPKDFLESKDISSKNVNQKSVNCAPIVSQGEDIDCFEEYFLQHSQSIDSINKNDFIDITKTLASGYKEVEESLQDIDFLEPNDISSKKFNQESVNGAPIVSQDESIDCFEEYLLENNQSIDSPNQISNMDVDDIDNIFETCLGENNRDIPVESNQTSIEIVTNEQIKKTHEKTPQLETDIDYVCSSTDLTKVELNYFSFFNEPNLSESPIPRVKKPWGVRRMISSQEIKEITHSNKDPELSISTKHDSNYKLAPEKRMDTVDNTNNLTKSSRKARKRKLVESQPQSQPNAEHKLEENPAIKFSSKATNKAKHKKQLGTISADDEKQVKKSGANAKKNKGYQRRKRQKATVKEKMKTNKIQKKAISPKQIKILNGEVMKQYQRKSVHKIIVNNTLVKSYGSVAPLSTQENINTFILKSSTNNQKNYLITNYQTSTDAIPKEIKIIGSQNNLKSPVEETVESQNGNLQASSESDDQVDTEFLKTKSDCVDIQLEPSVNIHKDTTKLPGFNSLKESVTKAKKTDEKKQVIDIAAGESAYMNDIIERENIEKYEFALDDDFLKQLGFPVSAEPIKLDIDDNDSDKFHGFNRTETDNCVVNHERLKGFLDINMNTVNSKCKQLAIHENLNDRQYACNFKIPKEPSKTKVILSKANSTLECKQVNLNLEPLNTKNNQVKCSDFDDEHQHMIQEKSLGINVSAIADVIKSKLRTRANTKMSQTRKSNVAPVRKGSKSVKIIQSSSDDNSKPNILNSKIGKKLKGISDMTKGSNDNLFIEDDSNFRLKTRSNSKKPFNNELASCGEVLQNNASHC